MCSQNWWLDHTTPIPPNVICDLLLCNKLPYHVILAGRSNHACKKQSNYSPLLYQKLSSNPTSSLYTRQQHIYCKLLAWNSGFLTMSSHWILSIWFCYLLKNVFLFLIVSCKALPKKSGTDFFTLSQHVYLGKGQGIRSEEFQSASKIRGGTIVHSQIEGWRDSATPT